MKSKINKTILTGILSAVLYSLCCIGPGLAFVVGATSIFSWITPIRPYLMGVSIVMLGLSWYQRLRPRKAKQPHCEHQQSFRQSKIFLGIVTVFVLTTLILPHCQGKANNQELVGSKDTQKIEFNISGMTCTGCETHVVHAVRQLPGIRNISASYKEKGAFVEFESSKVSKDAIIKAIDTTGYRVIGEKEIADLNNTHFDFIIIGGGSAAFSAAIQAERLGVKTLMVNAGLDFGGTCVNVGCVPSKYLIRAAEAAYHATHSNFAGIKPKGVNIDFRQVIKEKKQLVANLQQKKYMDVVRNFHNLTMVSGWAKFIDAKTILVDGKERYTGSKVLIATGSTTNVPPIEGLDKIGYLTHVTLFDLEEQPKSMTIMGTGYIGSEIAMAYNRLGTKVRLIEFTDRVLRTQTPDISEELMKHMRREGIEILPNYRAVKFEKRGKDTIIHCKCPDGSFTKIVEPGTIVVATGMKPNTGSLGVEKIGLKLSEEGHVVVNKKMEANLRGIYAAGDVANTPPFVYTAAYEGKSVAQNAFTKANKKVDYTALPWVVFTDPQLAGAGLDELQAKALNIPFEVSKLDLSHVPRALAAKDTRGFIKLIRNTKTDRLIGARVIAPEGGELIELLSVAIKHGITTKELAENFYPYLTLGEAIKLAAIGFRIDVDQLSCCGS